MIISSLKSFRARPAKPQRYRRVVTVLTLAPLVLALCLIQIALNQSLAVAQSIGGPTGGPTLWYRVQVAAVATSEFIAGRGEASVYAQISATLDAANTYFEPLHIQFELAGVQYQTEAGSDPYSEVNGVLRPQQFLDAAVKEWKGRTLPLHQVVVVFASRNFGEVKGLAYSNTSCIAPDYSVVFVTTAGDSPAARTGLISTLAHELGHFVGMDHDVSNYQGFGPSLMAPQSVANPFGFSQISLSQFQAHAGAGKPGSACFEQYVPGPNAVIGSGDPGITVDAPLQFVGGAAQTVELYEGDELDKSFKTFGSPGATMFAAELPAGARFDEITGRLTFTAPYIAASAKRPAVLAARLVAKSFTSTAEVKLTIIIRNRNRAPQITVAPAPVARSGGSFNAEAGTRFVLTVAATDLDGGAPRLTALNSRSLKAYPGRPKLRQKGSRVVIDWSVPFWVTGSYQFNFVATDKDKGVAAANYTVNVVAPNLPPQVAAPASFDASAAGSSFDVTATDPEGRPVELSFGGLPAGSQVTSIGTIKRISILPGAILGSGNSITVTAFDGNKSSESRIAVASFASPPKSLTMAGGQDFVRLYDQSVGAIETFTCSGSAQSVLATSGGAAAQFLTRRIGADDLAAVFFYREGAGIWGVSHFDSNGAQISVEEMQWGLAGDTAVVGDFDGDKLADLAVVRGGNWLIKLGAGGSLSAESLGGGALNVPFAGDIDGDGREERIVFFRDKSGAAVFRAGFADGRSVDYLVARPELSEAVSPAVADLDGNGTAELIVRLQSGQIAVVSPSAGAYYPALNDSRAAKLAFEACSNGISGVLAQYGEIGSTRISATTSAIRSAVRATGPVFGDLNGDRRFDLSVVRSDIRKGVSQWYSNIAGGPAVGAEVDLGYAYSVSGDFLGAGHSQLGLFNAGRWVLTDFNGQQTDLAWGAAGDLPVPADYNGDGVTDLAVFRPSNGSWWIEYLGTGRAIAPATSAAFGAAGDIPLPADYDGDGAADLAVYRPDAGTWFVSLSSRHFVASVKFGTQFDIPVSGDFDGTGAAQLALFRPSNGSWNLRSSGGTSFNWGLKGDLPVIADFNGDGAADVAVFRADTGEWYVRPQSGGKADSFQFGLPGDLPVGALRPERIL